jgi:hypothetical protein
MNLGFRIKIFFCFSFNSWIHVRRYWVKAEARRWEKNGGGGRAGKLRAHNEK